MRLRRIIIGIAAVLTAVGWTAVPTVAYAGGPTSVLVVNLDDQRATGFYHSDAGYDRLVDRARRVRHGGRVDRSPALDQRQRRRSTPAHLAHP